MLPSRGCLWSEQILALSAPAWDLLCELSVSGPYGWSRHPTSFIPVILDPIPDAPNSTVPENTLQQFPSTPFSQSSPQGFQNHFFFH